MSTGANSKTLTTREGLIVVVITLFNVGSFFLLVWLASLAWDRQHTIVVLERTIVFDRWDAFGLPEPQPIGVLEAGTRLAVLVRFHSIEGGGIRVKLPDRRYGHLVPFRSGGESRAVKQLEPFSILMFSAVAFILVWDWFFLVRKNRFALALFVAAMLVPVSLAADAVLFWGIM